MMAVLKIRRGRIRTDQFRLALRPSVAEVLFRHVVRYLWGWRREAVAVVGVVLLYRRAIDTVDRSAPGGCSSPWPSPSP